MTGATKILRLEYFGGVLFDRSRVSYRFLGKGEIEQLRSSGDVECREARFQDAPGQVLSAPIRVYWEITRRCDKSCPQCFTASGKPLETELALDDCLRVVEGLRKDNVLEIRITGGEPTTKIGWEQIVRHALDCGMAVTLNTHGGYGVAMRERIAALKIDQVIVSLDGPSQVHDASRGPGSFDRVMGTIQYLFEKQVPVRVNTLLTRDVLPYLDHIVDLVEGVVVELCFMQLKPIGRGGQLLASRPTFQEIYRADQRIAKLRSQHPGSRISTSYDIISEGRVVPAPDLDLTTCAAGMRGCNVDSQGDIYACGFLEELGSQFKLGNMKAAGFSILGTWYGSEELKRFRVKNLERAQRCRSCGYHRNPCFGSCIVMDSYAVTKSATGTDPYCYRYES